MARKEQGFYDKASYHTPIQVNIITFPKNIMEKWRLVSTKLQKLGFHQCFQLLGQRNLALAIEANWQMAWPKIMTLTTPCENLEKAILENKSIKGPYVSIVVVKCNGSHVQAWRKKIVHFFFLFFLNK